jgi:Rad3-related DNA helicase
MPINSPKNSNTNPSIFDVEKTPGFKIQKSLSVSKKKKGKILGKKKKVSPELKKSENESFVEQLKSFLENLTAKNSEKPSEIKDLSELLRSGERSDDNEYVFNKKLSEMTSEHERKVKSLEEHISELKKDNDKLKSLLVLKKACDEVQSTRHLQLKKDPVDYNKAYYSLTKAFYSLQEENLSLAKQLKAALCNKCKAFINTNNVLSDKIVRLRTYLNSE